MSDERILMRCDDFIFYNSKAVFVEYIDVIRSPYFPILFSMANRTEQTPNSIFDFSSVAGMDADELCNVYYSRRNQNVFYDFVRKGVPVEYEKVDKMADMLIEENPEIIFRSEELNFVNVLTALMWKDSLLAKKAIIYYPFDNPTVKKDVAKLFDFNTNIEFACGPIEDVLKEVPDDSTYVFSDITNIETLERLGKLEMSSILVPLEYGYNYVDNNDLDSDLLIDIEEYSKNTVFKFDMFLASINVPDNETDEEA